MLSANWAGQSRQSFYTLSMKQDTVCIQAYTRETQPYVYGDYSIFLAEIALNYQ